MVLGLVVSIFAIPPSLLVIVTMKPFSKAVGGIVMRKSVAVVSFSWTPSPQLRVTDVEAPSLIVIDGVVPSG